MSRISKYPPGGCPIRTHPAVIRICAAVFGVLLLVFFGILLINAGTEAGVAKAGEGTADAENGETDDGTAAAENRETDDRTEADINGKEDAGEKEKGVSGDDKEEGPELRKPQIRCAEADGRNGWYVTAPEITIIHTEPAAVTKYRVTGVSGELLEGQLAVSSEEESSAEPPGYVSREEQVQKETKIIAPDIFGEGKNVLEVWLETEDGQKLFAVEKEILLDLNPPAEKKIRIPVYADGNSRFFHSAVEIAIKYTDTASGVKDIRVCLDGETERVIDGSEGKITIPLGYSGEISVRARDMAGRETEIRTVGPVLSEDEAPAVEMEISGGADKWRQDSAEVKVHVEESGEKYSFASGLRSITCYAGDKVIVKKNWEYDGTEILENTAYFTVDQASAEGRAVPVTVHVSDRAGNTSVLTKKIFIDMAAPTAELSGVQDGMITADEQKAIFTVRDENILKSCRLTVFRTQIDGKTEKYMEFETGQWHGTDQLKKLEVSFSEDGKYVCTVRAEDASGRYAEETAAFVIDRTDPVIRYVEQLDGSHIPYFQWNYGKDMVVDLTDNSYRMYLNGRQYFSGKKVTEEGVHLLEVRARDQAGNESTAKAVFTIDHTAPEIFWGEMKNGNVYKEHALLSIWVEEEGERLKAVFINGERQKLSYESRIFESEILQCGEYIIRVQAEDLAGNCAEEEMMFEVQKAGGILSVFSGLSLTSSGSPSGKSGKEAVLSPVMPVLAVSCAAAFSFLIICKKTRKIGNKSYPGGEQTEFNRKDSRFNKKV